MLTPVTIKIFLVSSKELEIERDSFASLINQLNRIFKPHGLELELVMWEYLNSSMSRKRKQDEYNEELRQCDICIVILWNNLGKYTVEEFQTAYDELCAGRNPQRLYVFFKEPAFMSEEMAEFKNTFEEVFGHFYSVFENGDTLKLNFLLQLEIFKNEIIDISKLIAVDNSYVTVDGMSFVDLKNVSFAAKNNNYISLQQQIEKQRNRLIKYPDDLEEQKELHTLLEKRLEMEDNMISLAKNFSKQSLYEMSARMIEARKLFEMGELNAVVKLLDIQDIISDIKSSKAKIELYNTLQEHELACIERAANEIQFRIKAEKVLLEAGWTEQIINEYQILIGETRGYVSPLVFAKILFEAARFIDNYAPDVLAISYYIECIDLMKSLNTIPFSDLSVYGDMLFFAGQFFTKSVYEIDYDPTEGEWMDKSKDKIHKQVMRRWDNYKKIAKEYLERSIDIFEELNTQNKFSEDIFYSLNCLTTYKIHNGDNYSIRKAHNRLLDYIRTTNLSKEFLLSALTHYAITLYVNENIEEFNQIIIECEYITKGLSLKKLHPNVLLDISLMYEMKNDYKEAESFCRQALLKYQELAKEDPYIYQESIANCIERIATYVHWQTTDYKINPETKRMLDEAEQIYEKLYNLTGSHVYWGKAGHIKNFKFELRLKERMDYGEYLFNSVRHKLRDYFSSHITTGKHIYNIDSPNSPIKNVGTIIRKVRNKNEYKLFFTWEIDEWICQEVSFGIFKGGTKDDIYTYLSSSDCYDILCQSIILDLDKSWNMD